MAKRVELVAKSDDATRCNAIHRRLLAAIVTCIEHRIRLERQRAVRAPLHERGDVVGRERADRALHQQGNARRLQARDAALEARERAGNSSRPS
jgi:hypothetical protein